MFTHKMNVFVLLLIITYISIFPVYGLGTTNCHTGLNVPLNVFAVLQGKRLTNHTMEIIPYPLSYLSCITRCLVKPRCLSVNYRRSVRECHLSDVTASSHPQDVVNDADWNYYLTSNIDESTTHSLWSTADKVHVPTKEIPIKDIPEFTVTPSPIINSQPSVGESLESESDPFPFGSSDVQIDGIIDAVGKLLHAVRSCQEWKDAGSVDDGIYEVDPDGPNIGVEPFNVSCLMQTGEAGTTVVHHMDDKGKGVAVGQVGPGYSTAGSYVVSLVYHATLPQIIALTEASINCSQRIQLGCRSSPMWNVDNMNSWWVSRDGRPMENWGTPTGTSGCPCGRDGTCGQLNGGVIVPDVKCACDIVRDQPQAHNLDVDAGILTDKDTLPVKELRLATGTSGSVGYRVWPLECDG